MPSLVSNNILELNSGGGVDFDNDAFNIILMQPGFTFDRINHDEYADVIANECPTLYGYTMGGQLLAGVTTTRDDVLNALLVAWNNVDWLVAGGDLQACGAIILDDTLANDPVVAFIDFGGTMTTYNGGTFTVANPGIAITGV
jgi:hypothetical protein